MKKLFNSVAMCCFLVLALGLTSCEETISMQQGYSFGVHKFNGSWDDPFVVENYFKVEKKVPSILTSKEVELLLEQPKNIDLKGIRDKAMLEFAYATGMRVTEIISLNILN